MVSFKSPTALSEDHEADVILVSLDIDYCLLDAHEALPNVANLDEYEKCYMGFQDEHKDPPCLIWWNLLQAFSTAISSQLMLIRVFITIIHYLHLSGTSLDSATMGLSPFQDEHRISLCRQRWNPP